MRLFSRAAFVDRYNSHPAYFGSASAAEKKDAAGRPEKWQSLLARGRTTDELARAWRDEKLVAEATLATTATLFGMSPRRVATGFRYCAADDSERDATRLALRLAERPSYERTAQGPPSFEMAGYRPELSVSVDLPFEIGVGVRNSGGPSRGIAVRVAGPALDMGLVALELVELTVAQGAGAKKLVIEEPLAAAADGALVARFDVPIAAGHLIAPPISAAWTRRSSSTSNTHR